MTMLEILKTRLPEGLEIVKTQDRAGSSQMKVWFSYEGIEFMTTLQKVCAPGMAEKNCDFTICVVMVHMAVERQDWAAAKAWMDKQSAVYGSST